MRRANRQLSSSARILTRLLARVVQAPVADVRPANQPFGRGALLFVQSDSARWADRRYEVIELMRINYERIVARYGLPAEETVNPAA